MFSGYPRCDETDKGLIPKSTKYLVSSTRIMLVSTKLPTLPHALAAPFQPPYATDLRYTPLIGWLAVTDFTRPWIVVRKKLNMY